MLDLDELEEEIFAQLHHDPELLLALIAELRASRRVVEAARRGMRADWIDEALGELEDVLAEYRELVNVKESSE